MNWQLTLMLISVVMVGGCLTKNAEKYAKQKELYQTQLELSDQHSELGEMERNQDELFEELSLLEERLDGIQQDLATFQSEDEAEDDTLRSKQVKYSAKLLAIEESLDHLSLLVWKLKHPQERSTGPELKNSRDLVHAFNQEQYQMVVRDADYLLSVPTVARSEVSYFQAESLYRLKRYDMALSAFQQMLVRYDDSARRPHFLMRLSQMSQLKGDEVKAQQFRDKLWKEHPRSPEADHLRQQLKEKNRMENRS